MATTQRLTKKEMISLHLNRYHVSDNTEFGYYYIVDSNRLSHMPVYEFGRFTSKDEAEILLPFLIEDRVSFILRNGYALKFGTSDNWKSPFYPTIKY